MRILQIGGDQRVIEHKLSGRRRMAVTFFGDGQRNNRHLRLAHGSQHGLQTINLRVKRIFDDTDDASGPGVGGHFRHGVEIILGLEIGNLLFAANQVHFGVTPVAAVLSREDIRVNGLMSTMERAETEVHDAWH
ncbi:hypothetical protein D3C85_1203840 [compost metagenome]